MISKCENTFHWTMKLFGICCNNPYNWFIYIYESYVSNKLVFIRSSKEGTYYVMALFSRPGSFTVLWTFFCHLCIYRIKTCLLLCSQELLFQFTFRCDWFFFARVAPVKLSSISDFFQFSGHLLAIFAAIGL
jgi:hypothetical protein